MQVALQQLVHVETLAKGIRRQAAAKERALAEASSERAATGQALTQGQHAGSAPLCLYILVLAYPCTGSANKLTSSCLPTGSCNQWV